MQVAGNSLAIGVYKNLQQSSTNYFDSVNRISKGERIVKPGDDPGQYGRSEDIRSRILRGMEASRALATGQDMLMNSESWMEQVSEMIMRMNELAIGAVDSSRNQEDLNMMDDEFQRLKTEISRIARHSSYNGQQIAGRDQILAYDKDQSTFVFADLNGDQVYSKPVVILSGTEAGNGLDFYFDSSKSYMLSENGDDIFYVDSNNHLVKYDIEGNQITRDSIDSTGKSLDLDEDGRLWYLSETAVGAGTYSLRQQDLGTWSQDTALLSGSEILDIASTEFSVYNDRVYYLNTSGSIVSRNIPNVAQVAVELSPTDVNFTTTAGKFTISNDGLFVADVPTSGTIRVTNTETKQSSTINFNPEIDVNDLSFSADNTQVLFQDPNSLIVYGLDMFAGAEAQLKDLGIIMSATGSLGYASLSVDVGSNARARSLHMGDSFRDAGTLETGDARLYKLGLSRTSIANTEDAKQAIKDIDGAFNEINKQRAKMQSQIEKLQNYQAFQDNYMLNLENEDGQVRGVHHATEVTKMTQFQVQRQTAFAMLSQANAQHTSAIRALGRR